MYTKREAAAALGIDRNTLDKWLQVCDITPKRDPRDTRLRLLSEDDLLRLREHYAESHRAFNGASVHPYTTSADLEARLAALEATIAQLRQRAPYLFETRHTDNLAVDVQLPPYVPQRRPTTSTARYSHAPARPPVPSHLMSLPTWADLHGVNPSTAKTWREKGRVPVERGQWLEERNGHQTRIDTALTIEGRKVAHQLAHLPWPCERCMLEVEETEEEQRNETTPTHAVVEVARPDDSVE